MIQEIRSYFKSVINEVDSELREHKQYFTSENIADTILEDSYYIQIGAMITERQDSSMAGSFDVLVRLWKNGGREIIDNLDNAYCKAIEIQAKLMDQTRISQNEFIKSVVGTSITPLAGASNDNLAQFDLQFTVTTGYQAF